ncbi:MAG: LysR family transcriptional regulator, partial [Variovorax sp.]
MVNIRRMPTPRSPASPRAAAPRSLGRRLRFQQLELLSEVADCGTLGEAAERLHVSRAAVSKALKELEHALGLTLFERSAQGMTPTPAGLRVTRHARLLLNEFRHLTDEVTSLADAGADSGSALLRLGMPPFVATYIAPGVLQRLRQQPHGRHTVVQLQ